MIRAWATVIALSATGVVAQESGSKTDTTETCLATAETLPQKRECIGVSAEACLVKKSQGATMLGGVGRCFSRERQYWQTRLEAAYAEGIARAEANNIQPAGLEGLVPPKADAYREMQEVWAAFRDARCRFEGNYLSSVVPAVEVCLLHVTADRALYLEDIQSRF